MREVCHTLSVDLFSKRREPIAGFSAANLQLLDSSLNAPMAAFAGNEAYLSLEEKAAALLYSLIKNHAFPNGNKRIAVTTLIVFLIINDRDFRVSQQSLVRYARMIANSSAADRPRILRNATRWIARYIQ